MPLGTNKALVVALWFFCALAALGAGNGRRELPGHVPAVVARLVAKTLFAPTNDLTLAIGLPLRNTTELDELIRQQYDPASTNFHRFLTPAEFTARFGPTENDYLAVQNFARTNGFTITGTHGNRLVLDVRAKSGDAARAFHVALKTFQHPREPRGWGVDKLPALWQSAIFERTSVRSIPKVESFFSTTSVPCTGCAKLGQPVPESNLSNELNSGSPDTTST